MGIEIGIEDDDSIGTPQVYTDTSGSGGEEVDEDIRVGTVELIHALLPLSLLSASILIVMGVSHVARLGERCLPIARIYSLPRR